MEARNGPQRVAIVDDADDGLETVDSGAPSWEPVDEPPDALRVILTRVKRQPAADWFRLVQRVGVWAGRELYAERGGDGGAGGLWVVRFFDVPPADDVARRPSFDVWAPAVDELVLEGTIMAAAYIAGAAAAPAGVLVLVQTGAVDRTPAALRLSLAMRSGPRGLVT